MTHTELIKFAKAMRKQGVIKFSHGDLSIELSPSAPAAQIRRSRKPGVQQELPESITDEMLLTWSSTPAGAQ